MDVYASTPFSPPIQISEFSKMSTTMLVLNKAAFLPVSLPVSLVLLGAQVLHLTGIYHPVSPHQSASGLTPEATLQCLSFPVIPTIIWSVRLPLCLLVNS